MRMGYRIGTAIAVLFSIGLWGSAAVAQPVFKGTILEALQQTDGSQALVAAVQVGDAAGCLPGIVQTLDDRKATLAVFAPSTPAFEKFLRLNPNQLAGLNPDAIASSLPALLASVELTEADLCDLLLKHVAVFEKKMKKKKLSADALLVRGQITMADRSVFPISIGKGDVTINYESEITQRDVFTVNGVIHYVDNVIVDAPPPSDKVITVFLTNKTYFAIDELAGGDATCQEEASWADLPGTWTAWLSTSTVNAIDRIPDGEYRLVDGTLIANDKADLTDGRLKNPITLTQYGGPGPGDLVRTGTKSDGTVLMNNTCQDWTTTSSSGGRFTVGSPAETSENWTDVTSGGTSQGPVCGSYAGLYCFGGE